MRKITFILTILYCFFLLSGRAYGIGERTLVLGSASSWNLMEKKQGIGEASGIRPNPVLLIDRSGPSFYEAQDEIAHPLNDPLTDLYLSFDETGPRRFYDPRNVYDVSASPQLGFASSPLSRAGTGAVMFNGSGRNGDEPLVLRPRSNALFAPGNHIGDFSIEFWLNPHSLENGEQILTMVSARPDGQGFVDQRISCVVSRNRLNWTFTNFFFFPGGGHSINISLTGSPVLNRVWSHHLIRFDASLGVLEYLIDGRIEALEYVTSTGRESGQIYTPIIGEDSHFVLGGRFTGMLDEFRINRFYQENSALSLFPPRGGRAESRTLDLGYAGSSVLSIEAFGGRTGNLAGRGPNEYVSNNPLRFSDLAEIRFFIRFSNNPFLWEDWIPVTPGQALPASNNGRYIQIAADFYPGKEGNSSPYLEELRVIYRAAEPPQPPSLLRAVAEDGAVELTWRASPSRELGGYFIYFGTSRGEYFGSSSPIDAGNQTTFRVEGLNNGTIYYFAVAAYNFVYEGDRPVPVAGEFSREVAARPLRH